MHKHARDSEDTLRVSHDSLATRVFRPLPYFLPKLETTSVNRGASRTSISLSLLSITSYR